MDISTEYLDEIIKKWKSFKLKFPKINLPTIDFSNMRKPPRWIVITIAFLLEIILLFFILWLFDERTIFNNDYKAINYRGEYIKWGWVHMGTTITAIIVEIVWFFVIVGGEFMEYNEEERIFYKLYR